MILAAMGLIALAPELSRADFYKYVDEDGVVHITNVPTTGEYVWMMGEASAGKSRPRAVRMPEEDLEEIINLSAARYGVDPKLVKAVVKAESDFNPGAVSRAGAKGLMQLMPETAQLMGVEDVHDPVENVDGGTRYLTRLLKAFDWEVTLAVAAYNAGETAVRKYGGVPPYPETRDYVDRVLRLYRQYRDM